MKKRQIQFIAVFLCLVLSVFLGSCGLRQKTSVSISKPGENNPFSQYRVSCIIPHKNDDSYWSVIVHGLQKGGEEFGIDVKMSYPSLNYDNDQMIDLIRMAISARVDAIVAPGSEFAGYQEILEKAQSRGITVILVDTDMEDFAPSLYVGSDNFQAGELIGQKLALSSKEKALIGVISGDVEFYNLEQRLAGLVSVIDSYPLMRIKKVEYDRFDYLQIQNSYRQYLLDSEIDTIVCLEGTGAMAISPLLDRKPPVRIIAFDDSMEGLEAIRTGLFDGLVVQEKFNMGYRVISELDSLIKTGRLSSNKFITDLRYLDAYDEK